MESDGNDGSVMPAILYLDPDVQKRKAELKNLELYLKRERAEWQAKERREKSLRIVLAFLGGAVFFTLFWGFVFWLVEKP